MPGSSSQFIRVLILDDLFQMGGAYTLEELHRLCIERGTGLVRPDIKLRTIRSDLTWLKRMGAPLPKRRTGKHYYYTNNDFSLSNSPILKDDIALLQQVLMLLEQFPDFPITSHLRQFIYRISNRMRIKMSKPAAQIRFHPTPRTPNLNKHLTELTPHLFEQKSVQVLYLPFKYKTPKWLHLSPYFLQQYNLRWYLIARHHKTDRVSNFALDRIKGVKPSKQKFRADESINPDTYFKHVIGVSIPRNEKPVEVQLLIDHALEGYLSTKPLHHSQRLLEQTEKGIVFSFYLIPNYELKAQILSWGPNVKVLSPQSLAVEIARLHEQALSRYRQ